jgi:hypothetical protein
MQLTGKQALDLVDEAEVRGAGPDVWRESERGALIAVWEGIGGVQRPTVTITGPYCAAFIQLPPERARTLAALLLLAADRAEGL